MKWLNERNQRAAKVHRHDFIGRTNELPIHKDGWDRCGTPEPHQGFLYLSTIRVLVYLMDGRVNPEVLEEYLDRIGHATRALAEYNHSFLRRHSHNFVHGVFKGSLNQPVACFFEKKKQNSFSFVDWKILKTKSPWNKTKRKEFLLLYIL